ncbi:MAG: ComF family protein [Planctomycetota bacterium]
MNPEGETKEVIIAVEALKVQEFARTIFRGVNHLLWPAVCVNCGESISETYGQLCRVCWEELLSCTGGDYCRRCGSEVSRYAVLDSGCGGCQGVEIHFDGIARSGFYDKALQRMILSFKLSGRLELDRVLGFMINSAFEGSGFNDEIDLLVPVPLHWTRRFGRGFNQSHILSKCITANGAKVNTELVRIRRTRTQTVMASAASRVRNVKDAFAVRYKHEFSGKSICLVDDIKTTGATLNECAKTLKEAGASKVYAVVLAVAGRGR